MAIFKRDEDSIYLGLYYQSNDKTKEPIKWNILKEKNGKILIISEKILDILKFDSSVNNYEMSFIRKWINEEFYNIAFNDNEKNIILTSSIDNSEESTLRGDGLYPYNQNIGKIYNKNICNNTSDKVFLLSKREAATLYRYDDFRKAKGTEYVKNKSLYYCYYWLRSPAPIYSGSAYIVDASGEFQSKSVCAYIGVRPAMWIKKE